MEAYSVDVSQALEKLTEYLSKHGLKSTSQRRVITEVFFDPDQGHGHLTVDELYDRVRARDPKIGYATVYRTVKLLVSSGLVSPRNLGGRQTRYEVEDPGQHHDHLVCVDCGAIVEFEEERIEELQDEVAHRLGFSLSDHRMVLYGSPGPDCTVPGCARDAAGVR